MIIYIRIILLLLHYIILSCASFTATPVQSARVKSRSAVSLKALIDNHKHRVSAGEENINVDNKSNYTSIDFDGISLGFFRRVQISGYYWPYLPNMLHLWRCNAKIAIFDIGEKTLFNNFSMAAFGGGRSGNFFPGESDKFFTNGWGGLIFSTYQIFKTIELELVAIPSLTYTDYKYCDETRTVSSNEWSYFRYSMKSKSIDLTAGFLAFLEENQVMYCSSGITFRYYFDSYFRGEGYDFNNFPIVFQFTVGFLISRFK